MLLNTHPTKTTNNESGISNDSKKRFAIKTSKRAFYAWIAYQTIKGLITTTFIWIPLIYYYLTH
ncbi:MAG: hypothetical protein H6908_01530 [Hyphomicrobiales bacterium]|nr:hypothetical protein [Hyphomicrobiales bacterium]